MAKKKLSAEVAEGYNLVGVEPGKHYFNGFGLYDLTTMTLAEADELAKNGFTWLVAKKPRPSAADKKALS